MTTSELATQTGNSRRTITKWCAVLGIGKTGRDYLLTREQAQQLLAHMRSGPGRPRTAP